MALSRHFSVFHGIVNKPPIHEAYFAVTFAEQPSFTLWISVKINVITNLTRK